MRPASPALKQSQQYTTSTSSTQIETFKKPVAAKASLAVLQEVIHQTQTDSTLSKFLT